jgi:gamma-glutamyl-gamma-aminobutyrate hydrolase PuuD
MNNPARVALLVAPGEHEQIFVDALEHGGGQVIVCGLSGDLPHEAGGILIAGNGAFSESEQLPKPLMQAIDSGLPALGIGWGMHALNIALGGLPPVCICGHGSPDLQPHEHRVFIAPGGKTSYTIGGSGWVTVPSTHTHGLLPAQVADGLLSSVYAEDQVVEAIEKPGRQWLIGVQWPVHFTDHTPKGFDNLLLALVERCRQ